MQREQKKKDGDIHKSMQTQRGEEKSLSHCRLGKKKKKCWKIFLSKEEKSLYDMIRFVVVASVAMHVGVTQLAGVERRKN